MSHRPRCAMRVVARNRFRHGRSPRMMRRLLYLWVVLALISNVWRLSHPPEPAAGPDQVLVTLAERDGATLTGKQIQIAFTRSAPAAETRPTLLLLHGTPVASRAMRALSQSLAANFDVITPDLPGFGGSMQPLADYSSITHGAYLQALLDALDVAAVHVVAYSQGGAAALSLADRTPETVASLTLLSAIGVQELELFGGYRLNHFVYTAQHVLLTAAGWLIPHFGYLDNAILGPGYTRNLTDTDQRALRAMLRDLPMPTLIVHGNDDGLVPLAAAQEHFRLVPHSELVILEGGHELAFTEPARIAATVRAFVDRAAQGNAPTLRTATAERLQSAAEPYQPVARATLQGGALIVLMLAIIVASYVSEDLTCIAAGLLVAEGIIGFPAALTACLIGLFTGDLGLFAAGRWFGKPALSRLVSTERLNIATDWLKRRGPLVIVASRFMPGTRLPTYVAAGALHMPWGLFTLYFAIATALWTPLLVALAAAYGEAVNHWFERYASVGVWLLIGGGLAMWLILKIGLPLLTWHGRRRFYSRWRRVTNFEFWPRSAFYPPIVLYCLWLALRYRSVSLFTLANPGMPLGGLIGESKSEILRELSGSGRVAPFCLLDAATGADRLAQLDAALSGDSLDYPLALKPDSGERGRDVEIVSDREQATRYLDRHSGPVIAQRFERGIEYGVFYIRPPDAARGFLFSLTHKGQTVVTGDGRTRLGDLILGDARAVCMAAFFLHEHAGRLHEIPAQGERIVLNAIGTHSRGSLFTDARGIETEALTDAIDRVSKHFEGFYLGRYDIIANDTQSLQQGVGFRIIELNGVSSEATHMYDPTLGVLNAWRVTARQWRYAFEIGDQVRASGMKPPGAMALIRALRDTREQ